MNAKSELTKQIKKPTNNIETCKNLRNRPNIQLKAKFKSNNSQNQKEK